MSQLYNRCWPRYSQVSQKEMQSMVAELHSLRASDATQLGAEGKELGW